MILVHGEKQEGKKLQEKLKTVFPEIEFYQPDNCQEVTYTFKEKRKECKVIRVLSNNLFYDK